MHGIAIVGGGNMGGTHARAWAGLGLGGLIRTVCDQLNLFLGRPVSVTSVESGSPGRFETTVEYAGGGLGRVVTCAELPPGSLFSSSLEVTGDAGGSTTRYPDATHDDPYARQAASFLRGVEAGIEPDDCPTESAILALQVSLAARESFRSGGSVDLT